MTDRIFTTHVGSLPRSSEVTDLVFGREEGNEIDEAHFNSVVGGAVKAIVAKQVEAGIDFVSDGEQSKISYATYIKDRISGFEGDSPRIAPKDLEAFPSFLKRQAKGGGTPTYRRPINVAETKSVNLAPLDSDIARLKAALDRQDVAGAFMNAPSLASFRCFNLQAIMPARTPILRRLPRRCARNTRRLSPQV